MLYNLYRPTDFSEVKGQDDVLLTLQKQAQTGHFGHAYLLAGHRGTGKTTIARILSKAVNCENPSGKGPCKTCASCLAAKESLDILELDAASNNGVDKIKEIMAQAKYRPVQLNRKVFIIDEVHNLSAAAFDVLLKPLEEPSPYCTFILCTTELHKIPVTIRSRCEEYVFHPIGTIPMKERLREVLKDQNASCDEDALNLIVRNANGGLRDALGLTEQLIVSSNGNITSDMAKKRLGILDEDHILDILEHSICMDTPQTLRTLDCLLQNGKSPSLIIETTLQALADMITLKSTQSKDTVMHSRDYIERLWTLSGEITFERLYWMCEQYCLLRSTTRNSMNPSLDIRLTLIRISSVDIISADPIILAEEITQLKKEVARLAQNTLSAEDGRTEQEKPDMEGFSTQRGLKIPFCDSELTEYQEKPDYTGLQKGVMPSDRQKEETDSPVQSQDMEQVREEEDTSAFDLFKMLS